MRALTYHGSKDVRKFIGWNKDRIKVFVYFNNDIGGFAPRNAFTLKRMVKELE